MSVRSCFKQLLQNLSVREASFCVLNKFSPCTPGWFQHSVLSSWQWASGPWATNSALFCFPGCVIWSVGSIRACTGCRWRPNSPSLAVPPRDWSDRRASVASLYDCWEHGHAALLLWYHRIVYQVRAPATLYIEQIWFDRQQWIMWCNFILLTIVINSLILWISQLSSLHLTFQIKMNSKHNLV